MQEHDNGHNNSFSLKKEEDVNMMMVTENGR